MDKEPKRQPSIEQQHRDLLRTRRQFYVLDVRDFDNESLAQPSPYKIVDTTTTTSAFGDGEV